MSDIDLTELANGYNFRPLSESARSRAREAARDRTGILVDVGGGTGGHADQWVGEGRIPVLIDPSSAMCERARRRGTVEVVQAWSQALPLVASCAGLVYFHLSIHYGSFVDAIDEAVRIAERGALIEIWTFAPESMASSALARWFPRVGEIDADRFPAITDLVDALSVHGLDVAVSEHPEAVTRSAGSWELAVRNHFVSTLQLLTADEIDEGLARFRSAFPDSGEPYTYPIEFLRIRSSL